MAKQLSFFLCLYRMRRHSAGPIEAAKWAFELCLRNRQTNNPRLTIPELAKHIDGATSEMVNTALEELGFQTKERWTSRGKPRSKWVLTEAGKQYGALAPYQAEGNEHTGMRPVWFESVLELVQPLVAIAIAHRVAAKGVKRSKKTTAPASEPHEVQI